MLERRPLRIAVISHSYIVKENRGKLECLAKLPRFEVLLVLPRRWKNRDTDQTFRASIQNQSGLRVVAVAAWSWGSGSLITYSPTGLWNTLRQFRPDVILLEEEPWSLAALELSWLSPLLRIPLAFFTWENLDRRLVLPFRLILRRVLRITRGAVTGNTEGLALLKARGFTAKTAVLPQLGIATAVFRPADSRPLGVVGYVGRLVPQKGIHILLEAMARLAEPYRLMIVGRGPIRDELIHQARDLGLNGRFELHEEVGHGDVPAYMARMSILVLPSLTTSIWKEQFGHVLIEAMASGLPVIGSDSGAIPEVIGNAGLVVQEGNVEALAAAIDRLLSDSMLHAQLATLGRDRVALNYTNEVVAQRLGSFLERIASRES